MAHNHTNGKRRTGPNGAGAPTVGSGVGSSTPSTPPGEGGIDRGPQLELVGHTTLGAPDGGLTNVDVREDLGLAAVGSFVLGNTAVHIADITDASAPEHTGSVSAGSGYVNDVGWHPTEPWVFTANRAGGGVGIVDVSDPDAPVCRQEYELGGGASPHTITAFDEQYAIASATGRGLIVLDGSDPDAIEEVAQFQIDDAFVHDVQVRGEYAFVAHSDRGLYVLDLSDPAAPEVAVTFDPQTDDSATSLRNAHHAVPHPEDDICLVSERAGTSDPAARHVIEFDVATGEANGRSSVRSPPGTSQVSIDQQPGRWTGSLSEWGVGDQQDLLFCGACTAGVQTVDLSDPDEPQQLHQYYPTRGVGEVRRTAPARVIDEYPLVWGVTTGDSGHVYVSDLQTGLYVLTLDGY